LDQVANFIITNTKGMQLGTATSEYADPFTGGNRYVPGSSSGVTQGGGGGGVDPFTGSTAYRSGSAAPTAMDTSENKAPPCFPVKSYLKFPQPPNSVALKGKLTEFISTLGAQAGIDSGNVDDILRIGTTTEWDEKLDSLVQICLQQWPRDKIFPVLDLLRVAVLTPSVAKAVNSSKISESMLETCLVEENPTNQMLVLRTLCNSFGNDSASLMTKQSDIVSKVLSHLSKGKNNQVAAATLFLNYSILVAEPTWSNIDSQTEVLMGVISLIEMLEDPEGLYRLLVGIGNLISENKTTTELFQSLGGASMVASYSQNASLPKIKDCAQQLLSRLH